MGRDNYYDYIRALAALLVLFVHEGKLPGGSIGVSIFFCLSGFLITRILIGLPELSFLNLAKFIFRRWMRIFPLYLAAILATYFLMRQFRPDSLPTFTNYLPDLLTFTCYPANAGYSAAVFWTLHAEVWFYVAGIVLDYHPAQEMPDKLDTPSFVLMVIVVSYLTERFIERPGIRLSKALAKFRPAPKRIGDPAAAVQ